MQRRKQKKQYTEKAIIRMAVLLVPLAVLLLLSKTVFAQNTYVISDGGRVLVHTSSNTDPAAVLTEAGLALGADDTYTAQTLNGVSEITVQRSRVVTVNHCGHRFEATATDETVGELLKSLDITVDADMDVSVPMEMEVYGGMEITLSRTVRDVQTYAASIPFETVYCYDNTIPEGMEVVITEGRDGQLLRTAAVVYVDGQETGRTVTGETVIRQPVSQVVAIGTAKDPLPPRDPADELIIDDRYIYLPDGQVLTYTGTMQVKATAYNHNDPGCDMITYTGTTVHVGTVAVDPSIIPLGTRMFIVTNDGDYVYGISTAEDIGGAIKEARVDLYFPTYEECIQFGWRDTTIYFLG